MQEVWALVRRSVDNDQKKVELKKERATATDKSAFAGRFHALEDERAQIAADATAFRERTKKTFGTNSEGAYDEGKARREYSRFAYGLKEKAVQNTFELGDVNLASKVIWVVAPWRRETFAFLRNRERFEMVRELTDINPRNLKRLLKPMGEKREKLKKEIPSLEQFVQGGNAFGNERDREELDALSSDMELLESQLSYLEERSKSKKGEKDVPVGDLSKEFKDEDPKKRLTREVEELTVRIGKMVHRIGTETDTDVKAGLQNQLAHMRTTLQKAEDELKTLQKPAEPVGTNLGPELDLEGNLGKPLTGSPGVEISIEVSIETMNNQINARIEELRKRVEDIYIEAEAMRFAGKRKKARDKEAEAEPLEAEVERLREELASLEEKKQAELDAAGEPDEKETAQASSGATDSQTVSVEDEQKLEIGAGKIDAVVLRLNTMIVSIAIIQGAREYRKRGNALMKELKGDSPSLEALADAVILCDEVSEKLNVEV